MQQVETDYLVGEYIGRQLWLLWVKERKIGWYVATEMGGWELTEAGFNKLRCSL